MDFEKGEIGKSTGPESIYVEVWIGSRDLKVIWSSSVYYKLLKN